MSQTAERFEFQTEARQLLDLMIHSVYSNKDIFLRELISNSSDALDKLRVEALRDDTLAAPTDPHIRINVDEEGKTITVSDNGIGMNHEEVIRNVGTIARSGTKEFMTLLKKSKEEGESVSAEMIGQFGVGFYSTFMVADKVTMVTRRAGSSEAWKWESTGDGEYTLEEAARPEHGTSVTLHLKPVEEDGQDYTKEWVIRSIVKRYSDFVTYPVRMLVKRSATDEEKEKGEGIIDEQGQITKDETLNSMKAIWTRSPNEVPQEEYNEFYKNTFHDWADPLETIHFKAEGTFEYYSLLFIPSTAPLDLYMYEQNNGMQLYVKRVFIMDNAKDLMPPCMRFVRGLVDSEDLPLNISREILQENRQIQLIRRRLTKKVLETLGEIKEKDSEKFLKFWSEFGSVLKEGIFQEPENSQSILDVSLFHSTHGEELISLKEYIGRMKEGQETIYYIVGEDRSVLANSPHMEAFREKGYEVLILADRVDAIWTGQGAEYEGKKFQSVAKGAVDLSPEENKEEAEQERKKQSQEYGPMLTAVKEMLEKYVKEVRLSNRLTSSPSCVVGDEQDLSPQLERLMRSMGQEIPETKRIMELNPSHPILKKMQEIYDADKADPRLGDYAELLYGQALLAEGESIPDPAHFSKLVADLMVKA